MRPLAWRRHGSGDNCIVFSANQGPWTHPILQFWCSLADDAARFDWQGITRQSISSILKNEKKSDTESELEEVRAPTTKKFVLSYAQRLWKLTRPSSTFRQSVGRMFVIGGLAGAIECVIQQPLVIHCPRREYRYISDLECITTDRLEKRLANWTERL